MHLFVEFDILLIELSLLPSRVLGYEHGFDKPVQLGEQDITEDRADNRALCEASTYAKRCAKSVDMRPFSVAFLCIVSDDGFEIFLNYLSGGTAYATTNTSPTAPRSGTGTAAPRLHKRHYDLLSQPLA